MSANLSPEYKAAEQKFRGAATDEERLAALNEMLSPRVNTAPLTGAVIVTSGGWVSVGVTRTWSKVDVFSAALSCAVTARPT